VHILQSDKCAEAKKAHGKHTWQLPRALNSWNVPLVSSASACRNALPRKAPATFPSAAMSQANNATQLKRGTGHPPATTASTNASAWAASSTRPSEKRNTSSVCRHVAELRRRAGRRLVAPRASGHVNTQWRASARASGVTRWSVCALWGGVTGAVPARGRLPTCMTQTSS
jgi:hypothetical protein